MPISEDNVRKLVTIPKALLPEIEAAAKEDNRNVSNWIYSLIQKELTRRKEMSDNKGK